MKRAVLFLLAVSFILVFSTAAMADFTDTSALESVQQAALKELSLRGVVNGYPDGTFRPAATVTRAEFAKMICVFAGQQQLLTSSLAFSDVPPQAWYFGWVSRAAEQNLVNGYPGSIFRPQNTITQQEIATVLVRLSGASTAGFSWPDDYIEAAQNAGAFKDIVFVGAAEASRMITCQMLYNMLPKPDTGEQPVPTETIQGLVTELSPGSVTIKTEDGANNTFTYAAGLLPEKLIVGSYLNIEATADKMLVKVGESIIPKKGVFRWDISLDGKSATIDDKKYDLTEATIFRAEYTLGKPYGSESFVSAGIMDANLLSLGGRLAAEMAVVVEAEDSRIITAYLVNASIVLIGGRLDVADGSYANSKGSGIYFLGRDAGLPMDLSSSSIGQGMPEQGWFIHYTLRDGVINTWQLLLDIENDYIADTTAILTNTGEDYPYAWVGTNGRAEQNPLTLLAERPRILSIGSGRNTMQLGADTNDCRNYWLADGCFIYEVAPNGKVTMGSRSSLTREQQVIALVSRSGDICYIFCFTD
ncbi:MAG: S-layer homology domain-containing protein [Clostridiales bacterium]|nr:S-layer homology domain-containing protein [Clostridiales bacterium]